MIISAIAWLLYFVSCYYLYSLIAQMSSYSFTVSHKTILGGIVGTLYIIYVNTGLIWLVGGTL